MLPRAATITWTNAAGGNWSAATNWAPTRVPASTDDAAISISTSGPILVDVPATVRTLSVSGAARVSVPDNTTFVVSSNLNVSAGAIAAAGLLKLNGLNLSGGVLAGPGIILLAGGTNIWSGGVFDFGNQGRLTNASGSVFVIDGDFSHDLPGWTIDNAGQVNHLLGRIRGGGGTTFNNQGLWLEQTDRDFNADYGGSYAFANNGTFRTGNSRPILSCPCF